MIAVYQVYCNAMSILFIFLFLCRPTSIRLRFVNVQINGSYVIELILYILSVYSLSLSVCSFLYAFICLPEMVNKNEYVQKHRTISIGQLQYNPVQLTTFWAGHSPPSPPLPRPHHRAVRLHRQLRILCLSEMSSMLSEKT